MPASAKAALFGAGNARLLTGLLFGLEDQVRIHHLQDFPQGVEGQARATGEHAAELAGIDAGGLAELLARAKSAADQVGTEVPISRAFSVAHRLHDGTESPCGRPARPDAGYRWSCQEGTMHPKRRLREAAAKLFRQAR